MRKLSLKGLLITGITLLTLVITITQIAAAGNNPSIIPDKSVVVKKVHASKIKQLVQNENGDILVREYLSSMKLKDILETAAEFADEGHLISSGLLLSPYYQKELDKNPQISEINKVILDKNYNEIFRAFVLDGITNSKTIEGYKNNEIINTMMSIISDPLEKPYIRRFALLKLRKQPNNIELRKELIKIFKDENAPAEVRGASITAMRRIEDPNFQEVVDDVLNNYTNYHGEIIRYAAIEAAKSKKNKNYYTKLLSKIAKETNNKEVYGSTIFSLGIVGGPDAVKAIVDNYGRFGDDLSCNSALKRNYKSIISLIDLNQPIENITVGIKAAKYAGLTPAIDALQLIVNNSPDKNIVNQAQDAINYIKSNPATDNYHKWEVD